MSETIERNLGLSVLRSTEAAALVAGRWVGRGDPLAADRAAAEAMYQVLNKVDMDGLIVIGEEQRHADQTLLTTGTSIGTRQGIPMDVVVDAVEGVQLLAEGLPDAVSIVALAPRGTLIIHVEIGCQPRSSPRHWPGGPRRPASLDIGCRRPRRGQGSARFDCLRAQASPPSNLD